MEDLLSLTPQAGLALPTGDFINDLIKRYTRYGDHLFKCFDDDRIPSTSNEIEGFFGDSKRVLRHALGCGSTSNSVVQNLGAEALLTYHQMQEPYAVEELMMTASFSPEDFLSARKKLDALESPSIRRRSMVRHLERHLERLKRDWLGPSS